MLNVKSVLQLMPLYPDTDIFIATTEFNTKIYKHA